MAIETRLTDNDSILTISIKGKFNFSLLNEFREAYSNHTIKPKKIIIDMRRTSTIDSSALGMFLNMQRHLKKEDGEISIINCNKDVNKIFQITHFNKKFSIK